MRKSIGKLTVVDQVLDFLAPSSLSDDEFTISKSRLLAGMAASAFLMAVIYVVLWALIVPQFLHHLVSAPLVLVITGLPLIVIRLGKIRLASFIFLAGAWLLTTVVTLYAGGTRAPFFSIYILVGLLAGILHGWRAALGFTMLSLITGLVMVYLSDLGLVQAPFATPLSAWVTHGVILVIVSLTIYYIVRQMDQALQRVQRELAERKKVEESLRESEERFRLTASLTSDYTFFSRFNAQREPETVLVSGAFEEITGYTPQEFFDNGGWLTILHPDDFEQDALDMAAIYANQRVVTEVRIIKKNKEVRWVRVYGHPIWDDELKQVVGLNGAVQDVTERRLTEQMLFENEKRYREIGELMSDYAYAYNVDEDGSYTLAWITEDSFARLTGYQWDRIGHEFKLYHPEDVALARQHVEQTIAGQAASGEYRIITQSGEVRWIHIQRQVEWDEDRRRVVRFYGAAQDITHSKKAEESIRQSAALLRALLDATTDVAFLVAPDGKFLTLNKTMAASMGLTVDDLIGQNVFETLPPDLAEARKRYFDAAIQSRQPTRWEDEGRIGWWDNSIYPVLSPSNTVEAFAVYSREITEQKRLSAELQRYTHQLEHMVEERTSQVRRAKEQIEIIINNTSDAVALAQSNGDIETRNPAFTALFGDQTDKYIERILWAVVGDEQVNSLSKTLINVIYDHERQQIETQIISPDGGEKDLDLAFIPVQLADNSETGILLSAHNITHLKEIERFKARFVADALHDLATPITGLSTRLYLLKRSPEKLDDHVRALENQVEHLRNLLGDLRSLSQFDRGQLSLHLEPCNLNNLVLRVFDTYEPVAINKEQSLKLITDPALPDAQLDPGLVERVLVNLVSNAINYTPNGKTVRLQTALEDYNLVFTVADEGMGISPDELPHIFERFFRANRARQAQSDGTGLGLAIVKEIVDLHGGQISVTSVPDQGTTFKLLLPLRQ